MPASRHIDLYIRMRFCLAIAATFAASRAYGAPIEDELGLNAFLNSAWWFVHRANWALLIAGVLLWRLGRIGPLFVCLVLALAPHIFMNTVQISATRQMTVNIIQVKQLFTLSSWLMLAYALVCAARFFALRRRKVNAK